MSWHTTFGSAGTKKLWICWNQEALDLFRSLDSKIWEEVDQNPVELLNHIPYKRLQELAADPEVIGRMEAVYKNFRAYMDEKPNAKARFCGLSLHGIRHEPQCQDLLRRSRCFGRRLCEGSLRL